MGLHDHRLLVASAENCAKSFAPVIAQDSRSSSALSVSRSLCCTRPLKGVEQRITFQTVVFHSNVKRTANMDMRVIYVSDVESGITLLVRGLGGIVKVQCLSGDAGIMSSELM